MRLIPLCVLLSMLALPGCGQKTAPTPPKPENKPVELTKESPTPENGEASRSLQRLTDRTPRELLEKTVDAYKKARSYSDHGMARIVGRMTDPAAEPASWPCTVAYGAPGHLRVEVNEGMLVSDGEDCFAQVRTLENQVLRFSTPETWSLETLFQDLEFDRASDLGLPETILRFPPQLILLFATDPLKTLLPEGASAEFLDPQWIKELPCDLIRISHPTGNRILWIGRNDGALLRFDYLVEGLSVPEGVESIRLLRIDLGDAAFDREIAPEAFRMLQPVDAKIVTEFQPPESSILGQKPNAPETLRIRTLDVEESGAEPVEEALSELTEKTVVLCFWTAWSEPSEAMLVEMTAVRERFADDGRVCFFAVNLDDRYPEKQGDKPPSVGEIAKSIRQASIDRPFSLAVRSDVDGRLSEAFGVDSIPTLVVLAPGNRIEFYYRGIVPETLLDGVVREILGGGKPHEKERELLAKLREEHRTELRTMTRNDLYALAPATSVPESRPSPAPPKEPKTFSLEERWSLHSLPSPGNLTLLPASSDSSADAPLLLLPCEGNLLAVIDATGKLVRKAVPSGVNADELLALVRTGVDGTGKRLIGVSSVGGRAVHVFDDALEPICSCPADREPTAPENTSDPSPRKIVSDFRFANLGRNGEQALILGLIGIAPSATGNRDSLRVVGLREEEIWRDDIVSSPFLVDTALVQGKRNVYSLNIRDGRSTLLKYDAQGTRLKPLEMEHGFQVLWFAPAEESDPATPTELCVVLSDPEGRSVQLAGLDGEGKVLWQHPLPAGNYHKPIEQILSGDLLGDSRKEWIVPAPDGTVFVFDRSGTLLDSFGFGVFPTGMAVVSEGDRRLLVVVDDRAVTAWEVVDPTPGPLIPTP